MLRTHLLMLLFMLAVRSQLMGGTENSGIPGNSAQIRPAMTEGGLDGPLSIRTMLGGTRNFEAIGNGPRLRRTKMKAHPGVL